MIRDAYYSSELDFQASALYAMGRNCNPSWLPLLLKELHSPNPQLRFEAVLDGKGTGWLTDIDIALTDITADVPEPVGSPG